MPARHIFNGTLTNSRDNLQYWAGKKTTEEHVPLLSFRLQAIVDRMIPENACRSLSPLAPSASSRHKRVLDTVTGVAL